MLTCARRLSSRRQISLLILALSLCLGCGGSNSNNTHVVAPTTIVFSSNRALDGSDADNNGVFNVWAIKSDGSVATPLTHLTTVAYPGETSNPVFSPDGSKIVFSSGAALDGSDNPNGAYGTLNIWVMNADGSGAKPLTKVTSAQMDCRWPVWSPDGSKIAYYSQRALDGSDIISSDPYNIWVLSADGSNDVPITQLTAYAADSLSAMVARRHKVRGHLESGPGWKRRRKWLRALHRERLGHER